MLLLLLIFYASCCMISSMRFTTRISLTARKCILVLFKNTYTPNGSAIPHIKDFTHIGQLD